MTPDWIESNRKDATTLWRALDAYIGQLEGGKMPDAHSVVAVSDAAETFFASDECADWGSVERREVEAERLAEQAERAHEDALERTGWQATRL